MRRLLMFLLAGALLAGAAPLSFLDDFNNPALDPAWSTTPGQGTYSLTDRPGYLRYAVTGSTHPNGPALTIFRPFDGTDWLLEAEVDYTFGPGNGRQQWLNIYFNNTIAGATSNLTWARSRDDFGGGPVSGEDFATGLDGGIDGPYIHEVPLSQGTYWVRIQREGQTLNVYRSIDQFNWDNFLSYTYTTPLGNQQVIALFGYSFAGGQQAIADYNYIQLQGVPEPGTVGMACLGLGALLLARRWR